MAFIQLAFVSKIAYVHMATMFLVMYQHQFHLVYKETRQVGRY